MSNQGKTLVSWTFPEFVKYKRTKAWYFWFFLISGALLIYSLLTRNFLFSLIIVIACFIIIVYAKREPLQVKFAITEDGIKIGEKFYPYKDIKNFYIIYEPPEIKNLYFSLKSTLRPHLSIPLENQNPVKVREILKKYLEEDLTKKSPPLGEEIERWLKI